jgi:ubiquitin C-terminal hydrolase
MVHQGNSATFGHYKLCLLLSEEWYEFNDKHVSKIDRSAVDEYKNKGEICCLFYRRPLLACNNNKIPIPFPLKNSVSKFEK